MEREILAERLRQARLSFNVALSLTVVSTITTAIYVGLLLSGKLPEQKSAVAEMLGSGLVSVGLLTLTKNANDRLDRIAIALDEDDEDDEQS